MYQIKDKIILITGGNKGIGKATAELLAQKGATILFTSRKPDQIPALEAELSAKGASKVKGYVFDITNIEDPVSLTEEIISEFGRIDVLINNAGIGLFKNIVEMSIDQWQDVINTNLTGLFHLTKLVLPSMISQKGGHIVNVGSLASRNTFPGGGAYCASKFGLLGFSECLMLDVRQHNIKVSIIMPGSVNTPFHDQPVVDDEETWKLTATDVAEAIYDVINTRSGHLMSRVELRPLLPASKG
ncbi:MAG: SDR family NAD(P)-dependent oxidoreductase [Spirochaetota bacterium]|nr:SDR family NAD(P)-dependent oxidoreductase [Spirochaetota bacterium]